MGKIKILIIDDQAFIRHIYKNELQKKDFDILDAESAKEALSLIKINPNIDLILLDAMMPVMNGFDTCKTIKANPQTKNIPVIFLTANADKQSVINAVQAGGSDFFVKGQDIEKLIVKIQKVMQKSQINNSKSN